MDTVHGLLSWTIYVSMDRLHSQSIAPGIGRRWMQSPIYCGGQCQSIGSNPCLLFTAIDHARRAAKFPNLIVVGSIYL